MVSTSLVLLITWLVRLLLKPDEYTLTRCSSGYLSYKQTAFIKNFPIIYFGLMNVKRRDVLSSYGVFKTEE